MENLEKDFNEDELLERFFILLRKFNHTYSID